MVKFDKINDLLLAYSCKSYAPLIPFSSRTFVSVIKYFINLIYQRLSTDRGMTASKIVLNQAKVVVMGRREDEQHLSNSSLLSAESCSTNTGLCVVVSNSTAPFALSSTKENPEPPSSLSY